jgi:hypothetical protein
MELEKILKVVKFSGNREIKEITIDKNKIIATSPDESVAIRFVNKSDILGETKIGLQKLDKLLSYLSLVGKEYKTNITENRLTISASKRKISVLLKDPNYISSSLAEDNFDKLVNSLKDGNKFVVEVNKLSVISQYLSITELDNFILETKDNELKIIIKNKNTDNIEETIEVKGKGKVEVKLGLAFVEALSVLEGEVNLTFKENYPILVSQKTDDYSVEILIGLYGKTEEETTPKTK